MCLLIFALNAHRQYPLIVAANRDEFYARPSSGAAYWSDHPSVLAGRDLEKGGTWLGITTSGRFAALTNFRDPGQRKTNPKSRGHLVAGFLTGDASPRQYLGEVAAIADEYEAFNLIVAANTRSDDSIDSGTLVCASLSSRDLVVRILPPGIYGLSNHVLDTPWPKVLRAKAAFSSAIADRPDASQLLALLSDPAYADDSELPQTGVSLEWERRLSPIFIASPEYGTRASTVVLFERERGIHFWERSFGNDGVQLGEVEYRAAQPVSG